MLTKKIGKDVVPAIGQGTFGLGGYYSPYYSSDSHYVECLKFGFECGMTLVDTAENYACGHAEELVGEAIKQYDREKLFICTKVSPENLRYDDVIRSCRRSRERLGIDTIDLYIVHWPNPEIPIEGTMFAMNHLLNFMYIRHIGLSNFSIRQIEEARQYAKIDAIQSEYNMFDRTASDKIIPYCQDNKIAFMAYSPLDTGNLRRDAVKSLQWLIAHDGVIAIPKSSNFGNIKQNASVMCGNLWHRDEIILLPSQIDVDELEEDGFIPSVNAVASALLLGDRLKPIRVKQLTYFFPENQYKLVSGKLRYYAWVKAFGDKPMPCLVRSDCK